MIIPPTNYVINETGKKVFVQIAVKDWELLIEEIKKLEEYVAFKEELQSAIKEVHQIKKGEKQGIPLNQLLNEL